MDVPRRIARSRVVLGSIAAAIFGGISGCSTFALEPSDYLPSKETWEKLSPSNLWYDLQPSRLQRLNEEDTGMTSDVYYSVSDSLTPNPGSAAVQPAADAGKTRPVRHGIFDNRWPLSVLPHSRGRGGRFDERAGALTQQILGDLIANREGVCGRTDCL